MVIYREKNTQPDFLLEENIDLIMIRFRLEHTR